MGPPDHSAKLDKRHREVRGQCRNRAERAPGNGGRFTLACLDPSYLKNLLASVLAVMRDGGWLANPPVAIAERTADEKAVPGGTTLGATVEFSCWLPEPAFRD